MLQLSTFHFSMSQNRIQTVFMKKTKHLELSVKKPHLELFDSFWIRYEHRIFLSLIYFSKKLAMFSFVLYLKANHCQMYKKMTVFVKISFNLNDLILKLNQIFTWFYQKRINCDRQINVQIRYNLDRWKNQPKNFNNQYQLR